MDLTQTFDKTLNTISLQAPDTGIAGDFDTLAGRLDRDYDEVTRRTIAMMKPGSPGGA
jgi:hypothetical protein